MPKSNRNTPSIPTQTTFKVGDKVLCPSIGQVVHTLIADPHGRKHLLAINFEGSYFYYDKQGYFVQANATETMEFAPSLFANTPATRKALDTLFGTKPTPAPLISVSKQDLIDHQLGEQIHLSWFDALFTTIKNDLRDNHTHKAKELADLGQYLAQDLKDSSIDYIDRLKGVADE